MGTENDAGNTPTGSAQPSVTASPVTSASEELRKILLWAGYFCGGMAFVVLPILFGPVGVVLGFVNIQRGEKLHGQRQIALAAVGLVVGLIVGIVVNGTPISTAFGGRCSQDQIMARAQDIQADQIANPRSGIAAVTLFSEAMARVGAAMRRNDMKTACAIMDDLERRIR